MFERVKVATERLDPSNPYGQYPLLRSLAAYEFAKSYTRGRRVLDAPSGAGHGILHLAGEALTLIGCDISCDALKYAKKNSPQRSIYFCGGDLFQLPFQNESFDVVLSFQVVEHFVSVERYFQEMRRVLKKDGLLLLATLNKEKTSSGLNPYHVKEYTYPEFKALVHSYFPDAKMFGLVGSARYMKLRHSEERFGKLFASLDPWGLHQKIPKRWWELCYLFCTYFVNFIVTKRHLPESDTLTLQDFKFIQENLSETLDFMAVCTKKS